MIMFYNYRPLVLAHQLSVTSLLFPSNQLYYELTEVRYDLDRKYQDYVNVKWEYWSTM